MRYVDAATLQRTLDFASLMDALREAHRGQVPLLDRALLEHDNPAGTRESFLILPAWLPGEAFGIKVVTVLPQNPTESHGLPAVQAVYQLFDGATGEPTVTIDGTAMTYWKTAADSGLAARYLARSDATRLLMVGAGALAPYLVRAHLTARPSLSEVAVWNRTPDKAALLASTLRESGIDTEATEDLAAAVRSADVISCATATGTPLVHGDWLQPGTHLDLVGGFTPAMRESDDEAVRRARVFFDSEWYASDPGDISAPMESGILAREDIHDLFELCRDEHPGRTSADEITLYKNGGGAHLDLFTGMHILRQVA